MRIVLNCLFVFLLLTQNVFAELTGQVTPNIFTEDKLSIIITRDHPQFTIQLKSNPTTGYSWFLKSYDNNLVIPVKHVFQAENNKKLIGAPGYELWTFIMRPNAFIMPFQTAFQFSYSRPWAVSVDDKQLVFQVSTGVH